MLPAWLPSPASLPGREDCVLAVEATLAREGACRVVGPPGSGTTSVAGRVAARSGRKILACSFAGALDDVDVSLLVGYALGVPSPGDESSVHAALRTVSGALLVADEVSAALWRTLRGLLTLAPDLPVVGTSRETSNRGGVPSRNALPEDVVTVAPLATDLRVRLFPGVAFTVLEAMGLGDNLLAARMCATGLASPALALRLRSVRWLGSWPMGLPGVRTDDLPALCFVRDASRTRLRAGARALAHAGEPPRRRRPLRPGSGSGVVPALRPGRAGFARAHAGPWIARTWTDRRTERAINALLRLADGAHLRLDPQPADFFVLRAVGFRARETDLGVRALVAAARLGQALGLVPAARQLLRVARTRLGSVTAEDAHAQGLRARVAWAEGERLLSTGQASAALAARDEAGAAFVAAQDPHGHAVMLRQAGDRALQRGEAWLADASFAAAARLDADAAATARGTQAVERALGTEAVSRTGASAEDSPALPGSAMWVALRLEALARAIDDRDETGITALFQRLEGVAEHDRRVAATLLHRRAELALRQDGADDEHLRSAADLARQAADAWARLGERVAEASAWRIAGDAHAAAGDLVVAQGAYARAMDRQLRGQDLRGLARTLARVVLVEEALGNRTEAERRRGEERAVEGLLGVR